jgi:hypothetical protein
MKITTLALAGALAFSAQSALAADTAGMMKTINGFIEASLSGKPVEGFVSASPNIVDEVPPYRWSGAGSAKVWLADVDRWAKANGATDLAAKLSAPRRVEQAGSHGYVVTPAVFSYKQKGKAEREEAAMVFALERGKSGWRITSLAWTGDVIKP